MAVYKLPVRSGHPPLPSFQIWLGESLVMSTLGLSFQCHGPTNTMDIWVAGLSNTTQFLIVDIAWVTGVSSGLFCCPVSLFNCIVPVLHLHQSKQRKL